MSTLYFLAFMTILACNNSINNSLNITYDSSSDTGARSGSHVDTFFIENTDSLRSFAKKWSDNRFWDVFQIDTSLKHLPVFKKLDSVPEIQQMFEQLEEGQKRSVAMDHYETELGYVSDAASAYVTRNFSEVLVCHAYLNRDEDTLWLNIGFGTGFSGWGTTVYITKNVFKTMPYYFDDIVDMDEKEPLNFPFSQSLILNRRHYKMGDSIFGYVGFKSIYYNEYEIPSKHNVKGFFRTKVNKDWRR